MCLSVTSVLLATDTAMPFSLGMLLELLFGELGPEPGALLHAESVTQHRQNEMTCKRVLRVNSFIVGVSAHLPGPGSVSWRW